MRDQRSKASPTVAGRNLKPGLRSFGVTTEPVWMCFFLKDVYNAQAVRTGGGGAGRVWSITGGNVNALLSVCGSAAASVNCPVHRQTAVRSRSQRFIGARTKINRSQPAAPSTSSLLRTAITDAQRRGADLRKRGLNLGGNLPRWPLRPVA